MLRTDSSARVPLALWPHTGVHAPCRLTTSDYREHTAEAGRTVFTATLNHQGLGPVGTVMDTGDDGPTHFFPADHSGFTVQDLEAFVRASRQDDTPFLDGPDGVGQLLCAVVDETAAADAVHAIRSTNGLLVRGVLPSPSPRLPAQRLRPSITSPIPLTTEDRASVERALFDKVDPALDAAGLFWEMWNGRQWTALVNRSGNDAVPATVLADQVMPILRDAAGTVPDGDEILNAGPVPSGPLAGCS